MENIKALEQLLLLLLEQVLAPPELGLRGLQPGHVPGRHVEQAQLGHLLVGGHLRDEALQAVELTLQLDAALALHGVVDLAVDLHLAVLEVGNEFAQGGRLGLDQRADGADRLTKLAAVTTVAQG